MAEASKLREIIPRDPFLRRPSSSGPISNSSLEISGEASRTDVN